MLYLGTRYPCFLACTIAGLVVFLLTSTSAAQKTTPSPPEAAFSEALNKYPGLLPEFGVLIDKLRRNLEFPSPRHQTAILPLLAPSTTYYIAFPNYGEVSHQALAIFRDELKQSPVLRSWWQQGDMAKTGPEIEDSIEKFYELSQYLGDEIVLSGEPGGSHRNLLIVAEVRKPGLKEFLQQMLKELSDKSKPNLRILDLRDLPVAKGRVKATDFVVLVRPDFVIAAPELDAVLQFNSRLEARGQGLPSTPFGQRLTQAYEGGTSIVGAGNLHSMLSQIPAGAGPNEKTFERSGFKDLEYLVWEHKNVSGQGTSETELSFIGPRHGAASWLAAPAPLGGLDFVSPKAVMVASVLLKNFAEIFDDVKELSAASDPNPLATLPQAEQAMQINLRDDLLSHFQGETTIEVRDIVEPQPAWNVMLRVGDPEGLQRTLDKLFLSAPVQSSHFEKDGIRYHALTIPSAQKPQQIFYVFANRYLIISSSQESAAEAVGIQKSGESLPKSSNFLASVPPGHSAEASAILYEDPYEMAGLQLRRLSPELAQLYSHASESVPITMRAYGEDKAIRVVSTNGAADPTAVLVIAAIAIPNLLRARIAANESSAVGNLRTINTAQVMYSVSYPNRGFARDLATLGPDPGGTTVTSAKHAGIIDAALGAATCTAGTWCSKSGYRFTLKAVCTERGCKQFVAVATPESAGTGTRNFCSTSDGLIRFQVGAVLNAPISVSECRAWQPIQ